MSRAFSIAELTVSLLIGNIILAVSAPLISKSVKQNNLNDYQVTMINKKLERIDREMSFIPSGMIAFFNRDYPTTGWTRVDSSWNGRYIKISGQYDVCDKSGEDESTGACVSSVEKTISYSYGVKMGDSIRNITGDFGNMDRYFGNPSTAGAFYVNGQLGKTSPDGDNKKAARLYFDASRVVPTGVENQPKTIVLNACIKN